MQTWKEKEIHSMWTQVWEIQEVRLEEPNALPPTNLILSFLNS
jgi:hypothetical protein